VLYSSLFPLSVEPSPQVAIWERLASLYMCQKALFSPSRSPVLLSDHPISFVLLMCITMVQIFKNPGVFGHVETCNLGVFLFLLFPLVPVLCVSPIYGKSGER
jgi:hypothetical protein